MPEVSFFRPPVFHPDSALSGWPADSLGASVRAFSSRSGMPDVSNVKVVIMGVPEYRGSAIELNGSFTALEKIRHYFYRLKRHDHKFSIADIGDIQPGERVEDTYHAVTETAEEFLNAGIIPVILGGTQDLTVPVFNAYKPLNRLINLVGIDARFDLGTPDNNLDQFSWLGKIIMQQPNFLFNFSNIGYQTYFVGSGSIQLMNNLFFDAYRLGEVRANISEMEPVIRNADHVSFDLSSIRQSDAPASLNPSPNGFSGEEACQAMYYAGMNDRLSSLGIYDFQPAGSNIDQTCHLIAQMIWYFIEGINNRKSDFPKGDMGSFVKYSVALNSVSENLLFLKHKTSNRWWIELPAALFDQKELIPAFRYLPCSYKDYQQACDNEMPDRYWQALQKI